jgi:hypothetical protein
MRIEEGLDKAETGPRHRNGKTEKQTKRLTKINYFEFKMFIAKAKID